jgi:hypothetical protein
MPMIAAAARRLNRRFDSEHIRDFAAQAELFRPGSPLQADKMIDSDPKLAAAFQAYLDRLPGGFVEALRGVVYYALTQSPPKPITFAWAPSYDYELNVWEPACGITVLLKGRYPRDLGGLDQGDF